MTKQRYIGYQAQLQTLITRITETVVLHAPACHCEESEDLWLDSFPRGMSLAEAEKAIVLRTLLRNQNNRTHTAKELQISLRGLRNMIKAYGEYNSDAADDE